MDPDDPHGQDDRLIESSVVHLPIGRNVKVNLRSKDVLHNFTVTQFRVKMDLVPGLVSYLWLKPTKVGEFEVLCEELCGIGHFAMRGKVVVDEAADYRLGTPRSPPTPTSSPARRATRWRGRRSTPSASPATAPKGRACRS